MANTTVRKIPLGMQQYSRRPCCSPRYPEPDLPPEDAIWVIVRENGVYTGPGTPPCPLLFHQRYPAVHSGPAPAVTWDTMALRPVYALEVEADPAPSRGHVSIPIPATCSKSFPDEELGCLRALAVRIIDFDRTTRFCGQCGSTTRQSRKERAKVCDTCGPSSPTQEHRPRSLSLSGGTNASSWPSSPPFSRLICIASLPGSWNQVRPLRRPSTARSGKRPASRFSNIRYLGSEPWPFPGSLMIGFCRGTMPAGEIAIDNNEITAAGWFDRDHLPPAPPEAEHLAGARRLVDQKTGARTGFEGWLVQRVPAVTGPGTRVFRRWRRGDWIISHALIRP